jgi:hypothetical protein
MEEPPHIPAPPPEPPPPAMTLAARLLNVFAIPGEVFREVKVSRVSVGNWLVPALLSAVVAVFTALVILSQPAIQKQMHELTERQAKAVEQQVKAGKIKQAEADQALAVMRAVFAPSTLKTLGSVAGGVVGFVRVFWWAFILWLLARLFLKVRVRYLKTLEVAGLGMMIAVLGAVVMLLLMVNLPRLFATTDLASALNDFDASKKSVLLLGAANVFSIWLIGVLSVGLARLASVPFLRAAWFVFAAWLVQQSFFVLAAAALGQGAG